MKPKLRVIKSPPSPEPPDYGEIYLRRLYELLDELLDEWGKGEYPLKDWKKRFVYLVIKGLPMIFEKFERQMSPEESLPNTWKIIMIAEVQMSMLTPFEFMTVFPISKEFDGHRYGVKDYHSTMEELNKIGMETPIGDNVESLLFDYYNQHVIRFVLFKMKLVDRERAMQGLPSMIVEFFAKKGVFPMTMMTDENGKRFMYDPIKQTTYPILRRFPRYLKVVN